MDPDFIKNRRASLNRRGLESNEIDELIVLEYSKREQSVQDQIRRYELLVKLEDPKEYCQMREKLNGYKSINPENENELLRLCGLLREHFPGFAIFDGKRTYFFDHAGKLQYHGKN